jgi:Peptidase family M23
MLAIPLLMLLQAASAPSESPRAAPTQPSAEQLRKMDARLQAMGLPPGLASWTYEPKEIHEVTLAPLFYEPFACSEHPLGQLHGAGDALGTDCMIVGGAGDTGGFERMYRNDGRQNADWYGWHAEVHAPFDGVVKFIVLNPVANQPGTMGKPPASMIEFERADGVDVVYAHIAEPRVKVGEQVNAGEVIAIDSNNGVARNPHVHVGAYKGREPLQIRWDLRAMGDVPALKGGG